MPIHDSKRDSKCLHDSLSCLWRFISICLIWCVSCVSFTAGTVNNRCTCVLSFLVVSTQPMPCVYMCLCLPYNFLCVLLRMSLVKKSARSLPQVSLKLNVTMTVFDIHHIYITSCLAHNILHAGQNTLPNNAHTDVQISSSMLQCTHKQMQGKQ